MMDLSFKPPGGCLMGVGGESTEPNFNLLCYRNIIICPKQATELPAWPRKVCESGILRFHEGENKLLKSTCHCKEKGWQFAWQSWVLGTEYGACESQEEAERFRLLASHSRGKIYLRQRKLWEEQAAAGEISHKGSCETELFSEKQNYKSCGGNLANKSSQGWWEEEEGQGLWLPLRTTLWWSWKYRCVQTVIVGSSWGRRQTSPSGLVSSLKRAHRSFW